MSNEAPSIFPKLPGWGPVFARADNEIQSNFDLITIRLKTASVEASGWALGKTTQQCEQEAIRRLMAGE